MITKYDKKNLFELKNFSNEKEQEVISYFTPFILEGVKDYISNINCTVELLKINDKILPIVIADKNYNDCLYVSIVSHYIKYTVIEFNNFLSGRIAVILNFILKILEKIFIKININKAVYINNWFVATNLSPNLSNDEIKEITSFLEQKYPNHALIFKSVDKYCDFDFYKKLKNNQYKMIINRQIFIMDELIKSKLTKKQKRKIKKDLSYLKNTQYKITKPSYGDYKRIVELYTKLYIDKYSKYNPEYTEKFFKLVSDKKMFELMILKKEDGIDGTFLIHFNKKNMTIPAVGHDLTLPKELGIYRTIVSYLKEYYAKNGYEKLNMSAGVADYKLQRGLKPEIEYIAVYSRHLNLNKKFAFFILRQITRIFVWFLCRMKLAGFVQNSTPY